MNRKPHTSTKLLTALVVSALLVPSAVAVTPAHAGTTQVFSFGSNEYGRTGLAADLGDTPIATPIDTTNLAGKTITQIDAGDLHSLLLADDGTVFSFGRNVGGRTGLTTNIVLSQTVIATPIDTTNLAGKMITQVAAGNHSLLLADDGTVFAFGGNSSGKTGVGTTEGNTPIATPIDTTNLAGETITQVAADWQHSLLLADDGTVFSFGSNADGRTGLGTTEGNTPIATPIDTTLLAGKTITQVAAGWQHSLLLADDGTVFSFGRNQNGRTGLGTDSGDTLIATPIDTTNLAGKTITQVAAGGYHSLLLADDGTVFAFGNNGSGMTGLGTNSGNTLIATPIDTTNLAGKTITQVAAGETHSLLLADDGSVFGFGSNFFRQIGVGTTVIRALIATPIDTTNLAGKTITQISTAWKHSLLLASGLPSLPGDFNADGIVDAADYTVWRDGLGEAFGADDHDLWKSNFGPAVLGAGSEIAMVPEPGAGLLMAVGALAMSRTGGRRTTARPSH